jgi:hypothetical protein
MTMPDMQAAEFMVGGAARLTLSAIFLLAALHAVRNWPATRETLSNYNLLPRQAAIVFAWLLPPLQLAAAMALLIRPHAGAALGLVLMAVFTFAIATNLARGRADIDCGCGGAEGQTLSPGLIARNLILMLLLGGAALAPTVGPLDAASSIGIGGSASFALIVYFAANQLLANRQRLFPNGARTA